jgi:hypothetical protein
MAATPKQDATDLMNAVLPLAEQMLAGHGEFYPYGGAMRPDGGVEMIGASDAERLGFDEPDAGTETLRPESARSLPRRAIDGA